MNSMTTTAPAGQTLAVRTIPEIEADILAQKRTIGASIVFIGRALIEAKSQLSHGEWGRWLAERVEFSSSSAENYMRIAREYAEGSRLLEMPYSKVLALLPVPKEEREAFADANNVEDKSVAEIRRLVKERDEAISKAQAEKITASEFRRRSEAAEREATGYKVRLRSETTALMNAKARIDKLEEQIKNTPSVIKEVEVAPEDYKKVMAERHEMEGRVIKAEEAVQNMILERNEALTQMAREIASAEEERDAAIEELEAERACGGGADPLDVVLFCDACAALLNRLFSAPYAEALLMTKTEIELKRYEDNVQMVMEWAYKTQSVIERVQCKKFGKEAVFQIL